MRILIFLLLISVGATAQDTTKYFISKDYGWQWKRGKFDSSLMLPKDTVRNKLGVAQIGANFYLWNGSKWATSNGSDATKLNISDTAAMLLNYTKKYYVDSSISANVPVLDLQDVTDNGSTTTNDVTVGHLNATSVHLTGVNGNGHIHLKHQSSDATSTGNSTTLFANSSGYLKWKNDGNYYSTLAMPQTANRVYTFQNKSYTIGDSADVASKLNVSDTASMLSKYLRKTDTSTLSNRINLKVNISDTSTMLSPYLRSNVASGTYATIANLALKLNISDTATMLNPYLRKVDTASLSNRINAKGNGTVTSITLGRGITGTSPITSTATIGIDTTQSYTWTANNTFSTSITTPQIYGSSSSAGNLNLKSTSNATLGNVYLNPMSAGNSNTNGCVFIGRASADPLPPAGDPNHLFGIVNDSSNKQMFSMWSFGAGGTYQNNMHFYRSNGTVASPRALTAGQLLLSMGFRGYDGTNMSQSAAAYQVVNNSAWTSSNHEARFQWEVTDTLSTTRLRAMQLNGNGSLWLTKNSSLIPYRTTTQFVIDGAASGYTGDFRALLQSTSTNGAGVIFGESTSSESYLVRYGSSYSGTYASGVNLAASFNLRSGGSHNQTLLLSGTPIILQTGTTTTNIGVRNDATGVRVDQIQNLTNSATSYLTVAGSFGVYLTTKTANYTATISDHTILADATSGGVTITLPTAATCGGRIYVVKKIDASVNAVTIATTSSQTIDATTTKTLSLQYAGYQVQSNGSNWFIIGTF